MKDEHPVAYASRALTPKETNYAQIDKELQVLANLELSDLKAMCKAERSLLTLITIPWSKT